MPSFRPVESLAIFARRLPLFLFFLALGVRLGYWQDISLDPSNGYALYHAVRGVPYSDAQSYDLSAAELAAGGEVPEYWRARRPIYSYLLAALYTWTGPSFNVALLLNLVLGSLTVVLIFLIFTRVFSVAVGLPVGLWAVFDPEQVSGSMVIMTEPLGFFFLCWHFWLLVRAPSPSKRDLLASGVLFAISNLTRTLTLFAFPFYFSGIVVQGWRQRLGTRKSITLATLLFVGLFVTLFPFMFAQWLRYGIFTLQDTTASHLFAATSPDYEAWDASIEQMADDRGYKDTKARYQFFMSQARENLFKYPGSFVSKVIKNSKIPYRKSVSFPSVLPFRSELLALSLTAIFLSGFSLPFGGRARPAAYIPGILSAALTLTVALFAFHYLPDAVLAFIGLSAIRSLLFPRGDQSFHLTGLYLGTLFTFGVFAFWDDRFLIFLQWIMVGYYFAGLYLLARLVHFLLSIVVSGWTSPNADVAPTVDGTSREREFVFLSRPAQRWCVGLLILFAAVTSCRVGYLRSRRSEGPPTAPFPSMEKAKDVVAFVDREFPRALKDKEREWLVPAPPSPLLKILARSGSPLAIPSYFAWRLGADPATETGRLHFPAQGDCEDGDLVLIAGAPTRYIYYFPRGATSPNAWRFFTYRDYERSVFYFDGQVPEGTSGWHVMVVFPGKVPSPREGEYFVLLGRLSLARIRYQEYLVEGIALIPWLPATNEIRYDRAILADRPAHAKRLAHWTKEDRSTTPTSPPD